MYVPIVMDVVDIINPHIVMGHFLARNMKCAHNVKTE